MGQQKQHTGMNVFSIQRFEMEKLLTGKPFFEFRRHFEDELRDLPAGSRIEFMVGHLPPSRHYVEWLPNNLIYCISGPDWRNNAEWVRLIQGGEEAF